MTQIQYNTEREKYEYLWRTEEYRYFTMSNSDDGAGYLITLARPPVGSTVIDFGCGRGRTSESLTKKQMNVIMLDFAENCLDDQVKHLEFVRADLEESIPVKADYGVCFEVMEHIPTDNVSKVINNIMSASPSVVFTISVVPDLHDHLLGGNPIHLTVKPLMWWLSRYDELGCRIEFCKQSLTGFLLHVTRYQ